VKKNCGARNATDHNIPRRMRISHCVPKARQTLRICNTYYFSTASVVTGMRLSVTLCAHFPSCFFFMSDFVWLHFSAWRNECVECIIINTPCAHYVSCLNQLIIVSQVICTYDKHSHNY
jgi:hypothetical protein